MSTIASPRASTSIRSPASSSRNSLDAPSTRSTQNRRNRAALRDYYGLKSSAAPADANSSVPQVVEPVKEEKISELDTPGFDPAAYVKDVLEKQDLRGVLKVEGGLVGEIRGLDGERKALVYDNYSKLIAATDTIRKMRTNMDPLTPTTSTLSPAISHIAETAAALSASLLERTPITTEDFNGSAPNPEDRELRAKQKQTVRWTIDAPRRYRELVVEGRMKEAEQDWEDVRRLLDKWKGVKGVEELRRDCEAALEQDEHSEDSDTE